MDQNLLGGAMLLSSRISLTIVILSGMLFACILPTITMQSPGEISTAAAQTVIAGFVETALSETIVPTLIESTITPTFESPTLTPSQTLTATLTVTPTQSIPEISVSVPTNCRNGPGKVYRMEGALLVGEVAQVYGRDPTGNYWYIRNPDSTNNFCWVWGEYATLTGSTAFLPVYTPPPTPTPTFTPKPTFTPTPSPNFDAAYSGLDTCVGWWVEIELQNTGTIPFESMGITVEDTVTNVVLANYVDDFTNLNGCTVANTRDTFGVGKTRIISAPAFNYDPSGHKIRTTIILCSDDSQSGTCVTKTINFKP